MSFAPLRRGLRIGSGHTLTGRKNLFRQTAHIYDLLYQAIGKDYAAEAEQLHQEIQRRNPGAKSLLDVACGTGGHLRYLRHYYRVSGVDLDPGMLDVARANVPDVELVQGDMRSLDLASLFDAIVCLFSSIGYMRSVDELHTAISSMARHLNPRGVLVVDGWVRPDAWIGGVTTHVDVAETEEVKIVRVSRARREGKATHLEMHHLVATLDAIDHVVDEHILTLFTDAEYHSAFVEAGLAVEVTASPMPDRDRYIGQVPD